MTRALRPLLALSFVALAACVGGCSTTGESTEQVRWNPTPEAWTLGRSHDQARNDTSITVNENLRQLNSDWKALWLMDRPSRMSGYPTPR
jgi:hypothetical protein